MKNIVLKKEGEDLISEDYSVTISGPNTLTCSSSINIGIGECSVSLAQAIKIFNKYHCLVIGVDCYEENSNLDLTTLKYFDEIKSVIICSAKGCRLSIVNTKGIAPKNLVELITDKTEKLLFNQYTHLKNLKKLQVVYDKNNNNWLEHKGIIDLTVYKLSTEDLSCFSKLTSLKRLKIVRSKLTSLDGIENIKNLETIHIYGAPKLTDLTSLIKSKSIKNIVFESYKKITDWSFLASMTQLRQINLDITNSFDFALKLPNLVFINAHEVVDKDCKIQEIVANRKKHKGVLPAFEKLVEVFSKGDY